MIEGLPRWAPMQCSGMIATDLCVASSTITRHLIERPVATRSNTKSIDHTSLAVAWPLHTVAGYVINAYYGDDYRATYTLLARRNLVFFAVYDHSPGQAPLAEMRLLLADDRRDRAHCAAASVTTQVPPPDPRPQTPASGYSKRG